MTRIMSTLERKVLWLGLLRLLLCMALAAAMLFIAQWWPRTIAFYCIFLLLDTSTNTNVLTRHVEWMTQDTLIVKLTQEKRP